MRVEVASSAASKIDFKRRITLRDKLGHFEMTLRIIQQEDIKL